MATDVHTRLTERMSAYLEDELPTDEKGAFEQHLATCPQCRANFDQFRETVGNLSKLKRKAPRSFLPDIQQQINARSRGRFFGKRWLLFGRIPFEVISLVMILVMLVYYILYLQGSPTTVTPGH
ncbi:MAG TPA: zf-HC2 domain-containing protein [Polyangia bacterium]|nr:zf-HC2 domain-containing protein [Polyangia bacterium]